MSKVETPAITHTRFPDVVHRVLYLNAGSDFYTVKQAGFKKPEPYTVLQFTAPLGE